MIPYGRQSIDDSDIEAVVNALRSDYLTTGPKIEAFENAIKDYTGAHYAVAVSNGTAALHCAVYAMDIKPDDEVIVSPMTFASSVNCIVFQGGIPVFADVNADTLLIDPEQVKAKITDKTKAIIAIDFTGQPCEYDELKQICDERELFLLSDACHALGATYHGRRVGTIADLSVFSFHPVKHITTGEGGMITTNNEDLYRRLRLFRNHGIKTDYRQREQKGTWHYEMVELGFNYRISDMQCALGISQLKKLPTWLQRRQDIAMRYDEAFIKLPAVWPLKVRDEVSHAFHLYVIQLDAKASKIDRSQLFSTLRDQGVGVNVHYIPVHLHPFYRRRFNTGPGDCPVAESAYENILSLPLFPGMSDKDVETVIRAVMSAVK